MPDQPNSRGFNSFALLGCAALAASGLLWAGMPSGDVTNMRKTWQPGFAAAVQRLVEANEDPLAIEVLRLRHELKAQQTLVADLKAAAGGGGALGRTPPPTLPPPQPPPPPTTAMVHRPPPTAPTSAHGPSGPHNGGGVKDLPVRQKGMGDEDVTGSSIADETGKIPTDTTRTICPTPSSDVLADNTITIYVQNPRCVGGRARHFFFPFKRRGRVLPLPPEGSAFACASCEHPQPPANPANPAFLLLFGHYYSTSYPHASTYAPPCSPAPNVRTRTRARHS